MTPRRAIACLAIAVIVFAAFASPAARAEAMGIALEGFPYPYPVHFMPLTLEGEDLRLAYMDAAPTGPSTGRTVVLLHGRNFPSSYWEPTIKALTEAGYRVIAPDQIGFGKSSKPSFAYSFDAMARATIALLDSLHVDRFDLVGHSMGGMLAVRLARLRAAHRPSRSLFPNWPRGLSLLRAAVDGRRACEARTRTDRGRLSQTIDDQLCAEPAVERDRAIRPAARGDQAERRISAVAQVVRGVLPDDLFPAGGARDSADRSADPVHHGGQRPQCAGRPFAPPELRAKMGQNAALAQALAARMANAKVKVFQGVGHLGHLEATQPFNEALLNFSANSAFRQRASGPTKINLIEGAYDARLDRICGQRTRARHKLPPVLLEAVDAARPEASGQGLVRQAPLACLDIFRPCRLSSGPPALSWRGIVWAFREDRSNVFRFAV